MIFAGPIKKQFAPLFVTGPDDKLCQFMTHFYVSVSQCVRGSLWPNKSNKLPFWLPSNLMKILLLLTSTFYNLEIFILVLTSYFYMPPTKRLSNFKHIDENLLFGCWTMFLFISVMTVHHRGKGSFRVEIANSPLFAIIPPLI